ncbi:MAG TPA: AGE family epimerase/isomerase [Bryobacteraceae bacterium]|nr:AGE family epimerase/isomerase [Bryobacteraceae bacterium]
MKRRAFFGLAGLAAAPAIAPPVQAAPAPGLLPLRQLRDQYYFDLFEDFLPFVDKHVLDRQYGGFLCHTDRDGTNLSGRKTTWYEGRGIWVYSFLYNHCGKQPQHLKVARRSVEFILSAKPKDEDTLWPVTLTRDGKPETPPATAIYGDLFIAEGLAEYARATGERKYWDMAKRLVLKCVRIYDRPDYEPGIVASYSGPVAPPMSGARIQGVSMVLIRALGPMLEQRADPGLQPILDRALDAVMNRHYNPEFGLNNELLEHDYSRPRNVLAQFVYTGHAIETLWMVAYESARTRNKSLFDLAAERFRRHVEVSWDGVYGGVFRSLNHVDRNQWALDKVLWAQEEVLIGTLLIYEHTGAPWAAEMFTKMNDYVRAKYVLRPHGYALWIVNGDRKVTYEPHTARLEVALSLVLLAGAGLLIRSVTRMESASLGFRPDHLLSLHLTLPKETYSGPVRILQFYGRLTNRVGSLPGVEGSVLTSFGPLLWPGTEPVDVEGQPAPPAKVALGDTGKHSIGVGYFKLLGIPLLRGRDFDEGDRAGSEPVAVVNEAFARRYFPDRDALGKHVRIGFPLEKQPWLKIAGVVGNTRGPTVFREMAWVTGPYLYRPLAQAPSNEANVLVRFSGAGNSLASGLPQAVSGLDPSLPLGPVGLVTVSIAENLKYPQFRAGVLSLFGGMASLLAAIGIYGVVARMVVSHTREIGVRMAVGATRGHVLRLIGRQGAVLILQGAALGLAAASILNRSLGSLLYETAPADPVTFSLVTCVLCGAGMLATYIPARRAAKLDPLVAIRHE